MPNNKYDTMTTLNATQIYDLKKFIESKLASNPCNHSLRLTKIWADMNEFNFDDLIDILESNGGFCDCEVGFNLPDNQDLIVDSSKVLFDSSNLWKLPKGYKIQTPEKQFTKILKATEKCKGNCYAVIGEYLFPAPFGSKPKKRIRKSVHFFIGISTGLPNEYGFVDSIKPITAKGLAKMLRDSKILDLSRFSEFEADFYLTRLENLQVGTAVGTHFMEKNGLTGSDEELRIHKIILGK